MNFTQADSYLLRLAGRSTVERLCALGLDWQPLDASACAVLRFKRYVQGAPPVVGLVGGASAGKSTLFNSLAGREVSRTSAFAHETLGPIAALPQDRASDFDAWVRDQLMFPSWQVQPADGSLPTAGAPASLHYWAGLDDAAPEVILIDLPDVTSKMSADEGAVATSLIPWLDGLLLVADEERRYDAATFSQTLAAAMPFAPMIWVIFNCTEPPADGARISDERQAVLASQCDAQGYFVSPYVAGQGLRTLDDSVKHRVQGWIEKIEPDARRGSVEAYVKKRSADIVKENVKRSDQFSRLADAAQRELAMLIEDTQLSLDLLTDDERRLLGIGHRFVPLYDTLRAVGRKLSWLTGRRAGLDRVQFDKREDVLADVLGRNFIQRFEHAAGRIDRVVTGSEYLADCDTAWHGTWSPPEFDAAGWASRIAAHLKQWQEETARQSRRADTVSMSVGLPLLLADLVFLGGAGVTLTWAGVWIAGFFGGKGVAGLIQQSSAFEAYQTTVKAYQALLRESLAAQWEENRTRIPPRHLPMTDPILDSLMRASGPRE